MLSQSLICRGSNIKVWLLEITAGLGTLTSLWLAIIIFYDWSRTRDRIGPFWFIFSTVNWTRHRGESPIGARPRITHRALCSGRIDNFSAVFYNRNLSAALYIGYRRGQCRGRLCCPFHSSYLSDNVVVHYTVRWCGSMVHSDPYGSLKLCLCDGILVVMS